MYPNRALGWPNPAGNYTHNLNPAKLGYLASFFIFLVTALVVINIKPYSLIESQGNLVAAEPAQISPVIQPPARSPATAVISQDNSSKLQTLLNNWQASHASQKWSVVVKGLDDNYNSASINAAESYRSASMFKLLLTYSLFQDYSLKSLGDVNLAVEGKGIQSLKTCVEQMIVSSDNPCGVAVGMQLGWAKTTDDLRKIGINHTDLNSPDGPRTTAGDTAAYLEKLYNGQLMDSASQQYIIGLMSRQTLRSGIPAGCASCSVADKVGSLRIVRHDAGIVQYDNGAYVLSIFTNGASYQQIAELTSQIQAIITR